MSATPPVTAPVRTPERAPASSVSRPVANIPAFAGAYVLVDDQWVPLPRNNGHFAQSKVQALTAKLADLKYREDRFAGPAPADPAKIDATTVDAPAVVASLRFDGKAPLPEVPPMNVVLVYVGELAPLTPKQLAKYPELKTYPVLELAPELNDGGSHDVPLVMLAPGVIAFGPRRVKATIEQPSARATLLRCTEPLAPGRYGFSCGALSYEVVVR